MTYDAIILCGGGGERLGGVDKGSLVVAGRSLLDRAAGAVRGAQRTIAVGPTRPTDGTIAWTSEEPPGSGPAAAIAAGLDLVESPVVVVLGVDFPLVDVDCIGNLLEAVEAHDGAILKDGTGHHQYLVGAYRAAALRRALIDRDVSGMAVRDLVAPLDLITLDDPRATHDGDTWADVRTLDEILTEEERP